MALQSDATDTDSVQKPGIGLAKGALLGTAAGLTINATTAVIYDGPEAIAALIEKTVPQGSGGAAKGALISGGTGAAINYTKNAMAAAITSALDYLHTGYHRNESVSEFGSRILKEASYNMDFAAAMGAVIGGITGWTKDVHSGGSLSTDVSAQARRIMGPHGFGFTGR